MYRMENIKELIETAVLAGRAILEIYDSDFDIELKSDLSPLTEADKKSHRIICEYLNSTGWPVLSEEGKEIPFEERKNWNQFWLVDPLDGTKEFIKRNGEFTVNIALIEDQKPVLGVIYAPVSDELFFGEEKTGAFKVENASRSLSDLKQTADWMNTSNRIPVIRQDSMFRIVASRSHLNRETEDFINHVSQEKRNIELVSKGSSLKLCLLAEGKADIYPRFAPTMEWDTAAGHAIVSAAGGKVIHAEHKMELKYNKENLLNPWFIAYKGIS